MHDEHRMKRVCTQLPEVWGTKIEEITGQLSVHINPTFWFCMLFISVSDAAGVSYEICKEGSETPSQVGSLNPKHVCLCVFCCYIMYVSSITYISHPLVSHKP